MISIERARFPRRLGACLPSRSPARLSSTASRSATAPPKGYGVYSIGRHLTDDGGKEPPANPNPDDRHYLAFTVERP